MDYGTSTEETVAEDKVRQNRLRRMAKRQGLELQKTRRYDPLASDCGTYRLTGKGAPRGLLRSLDEVERDLVGEETREANRQARAELRATLDETYKHLAAYDADPALQARLTAAQREFMEQLRLTQRAQISQLLEFDPATR